MKRILFLMILLACAWSAKSQIVVSGSLDINGRTNWTKNNIYILSGFVRVTANDTLVIEPGTVIKGDNVSKGSLIVERGGYLRAEGTEQEPIVFTSQRAIGQRSYGDWGGIILCGKASVNQPASVANGTTQGEAVVEGGVGSIYGGGTSPNDHDNSGILKYLRIEYGGIPFQPNSEINGLTMCGVGDGTTIEHVQVSFCGDDAFEWFGGTVNCKYLVSYKNWDDDFDTDFGYRGNVQFALAVRDPSIADQSGSNGFESDNDASGSSYTPNTNPHFSNVTVAGPYTTVASGINSNFKRGLHLRRNTSCSVYNSTVVGYPIGLMIESTTTQSNASNSLLRFKNNVLVGCVDTLLANTTSGLTSATNNINGAFNITSFFNQYSNQSIADITSLMFKNASITNPDFSLQGGSVLQSGADFSDSYLTNAFFTPVSYRGAFGSSNWASCWTEFDPQNNPYNTATNLTYTAEITASGATQFCAGGQVELLATSSSGNVTFTWNNGSQETTQVVSTTGSYYATAVNTPGCVVNIPAVDVTVFAQPTVAISPSSSTTLCQGQTVTLTADQNQNVIWSNGHVGSELVVSTSGNYTATYTDANGCSITSNPIQVTVNSLPTVSITAASSTTLCAGETVTLTSSQATNNNWSNGGLNASITVGNSGDYSVSYTDANGCGAVSNLIHVTVNALPSPVISASGNTSFCTGGSVTLNSNYNSGNAWTTGSIQPAVSISASGDYSVTVTDINGCSNISNTISVNVSDSPAPTVAVNGNNIICEGNAVSMASSPADSYQWYFNNQPIPGANNSTYDATATGFYTVFATNADACNGSGFSSPALITVNNNPVVSLIANGSTTFCEGNSLQLITSYSTGTVWSNGSTDVNSISVSSSGDYHVSYTDNQGCTGNSNVISVVVNANPSVSISANGSTTFCDGGSVTLTSSQSSNNVWTGNVTDNALVVTASGIYAVTYTDANGCFSTAEQQVTVQDQPVANFTVVQNNGSYVIQFINNSDLATNYSWDFGDGNQSQEENPSHLYTTGGDFTVTLTATNGSCQDVFSFNLTNVSTEELYTAALSLYPNPAQDQLTLTGYQGEYVIYSVTGQHMVSGKINKLNDPIAVNFLSSGVYLIKTNHSTLRFIKG